PTCPRNSRSAVAAPISPPTIQRRLRATLRRLALRNSRYSTIRPTSTPPPMRMTFSSVEVLEQQLGRGCPLQLGGWSPTRGKGGNGAQQRRQFARGAGIEAGIGPLADPRKLAEGTFRHRIAPFLEDEDRAPEEAELAGPLRQRIDILLHGVPDIDE